MISIFHIGIDRMLHAIKMHYSAYDDFAAPELPIESRVKYLRKSLNKRSYNEMG